MTQYQVFGNYNNHIAIVYRQTPKVTEYLVLSPAGPSLEKDATATFTKEYYRATRYLAYEAAVRFLGASIRAYSFNEKAILLLKEIAMSGPVTKETTTIIEAAEKPTVAQIATADKKAAVAEKAKAARPKKDPSEAKPRGKGIGAFIRGQISKGDDNQQIIDDVKRQWPDAKTNAACIAWYRNDMKKKAGK